MTERMVAALKWDGKERSYYDKTVPGFGVRVREGSKSFVFCYRFAKQQKRLTLGRVGVIGVEEAREIARQAYIQRRAGVDPTVERRLKPYLVRDLIERYIEHYAKPHKKTWKKDAQRLKKHVIPRIGHLPVTLVLTTDIVELHVRVGEGGTTVANRVLETIKSMYNQAINWGIVEKNPCVGVRRFTEKQRRRYVVNEELVRLKAALDNEPNRVAAIAVELYLLTGLRSQELLALSWENVHGNTLQILDTKNGNDHQIVLGERSSQLFAELREMNQTDSPWVFPSPAKPNGRLLGIDRTWRRLRKEANIRDVRLHDLRRTFATWARRRGIAAEDIGGALNHINIKSTSVYALIEDSALRRVADAVESEFCSIVGTVVSIRSDEEKFREL